MNTAIGNCRREPGGARQARPKIRITMEGGVVQDVTCDGESDAAKWPVEIVISDLDEEGEPVAPIPSAPKRYLVELVETIAYHMVVEATGEEEAGGKALETWANSHDPFADFEGQTGGADVGSVSEVTE